MDRETYRTMAARHVRASEANRRRAFERIAMKVSARPLSPFERSVGEELAAHVLARGPTWFHGGLAGRGVGDLLLPPTETGLDPRAEGGVAPNKSRFVYVTWQPEAALWYAQRNRAAGAASEVYRVAPVGPLCLDPELLRMAILHSFDRVKLSPPEMWGRLLYGFTCERATVLDVLEVA